jgi:outer membrane protein assembly factor BamB
VVFQGCDLVSAYNPLTGAELWKRDGSTTECVTSAVTDGEVIITSGGYPRNHVAAVRADGSNEIVWENGERVYVPSMLMQDGYLYAVTDDGVAICWRAGDGKEQWKGRLGGTFSASLVRVAERIYSINEAGECFVFSADPEGFKLLAENRLGDEVFATPAICGGRLYQRVAERAGDARQEYLYCIGEASP